MLSVYLEFLPLEGQDMIAKLRREFQEPLSILAGIHWVIHNPNVNETLANLIIKELNTIIAKLNTSNYSTMTVKSVASLTLTPDKCYEECFGSWEDYPTIKSLVPLLEIKLGRPMNLRPIPEFNVYRPLLWRRLQSDSFYKKVKKRCNGNK